MVADTVSISKGTTSDLNVATWRKLTGEDEKLCSWPAEVQGREATVEPESECGLPEILPGLPPRTVERSTFTVTTSGPKLTHQYKGEISGEFNGEDIKCSEEWTVTYHTSK